MIYLSFSSPVDLHMDRNNQRGLKGDAEVGGVWEEIVEIETTKED